MKPHPERVHPEIARQAVQKASEHTDLFTKYILLHLRGTGKLAPGCDYRDLLAWLEEKMRQMTEEDCLRAHDWQCEDQRNRGERNDVV